MCQFLRSFDGPLLYPLVGVKFIEWYKSLILDTSPSLVYMQPSRQSGGMPRVDCSMVL